MVPCKAEAQTGNRVAKPECCPQDSCHGVNSFANRAAQMIPATRSQRCRGPVGRSERQPGLRGEDFANNTHGRAGSNQEGFNDLWQSRSRGRKEELIVFTAV